LTIRELKVDFKFKMIVCVCKRVSDRQVQAAIDGGALTVEAVGQCTRAGTGCGCCREQIQEMIDARGACDLVPLRVVSPYLTTGKAA
jgi:bacterioferritin-associated ferredoxin